MEGNRQGGRAQLENQHCNDHSHDDILRFPLFNDYDNNNTNIRFIFWSNGGGMMWRKVVYPVGWRMKVSSDGSRDDDGKGVGVRIDPCS